MLHALCPMLFQIRNFFCPLSSVVCSLPFSPFPLFSPSPRVSASVRSASCPLPADSCLLTTCSKPHALCPMPYLVTSQHSEILCFLRKLPHYPREFAGFHVGFEINIKHVLPGFAVDRPGFQLDQVDSVFSKYL